MATTAMVRAYVRQLLTDEYGDGLHEPETDQYLVPLGKSGVRVWVVDGNHPARRALATAWIGGIEDKTVELLQVLNQLNAVTLYGRYFVDQDEDVMVEETVLAESLDPGELFNAINFVGWAADLHRATLSHLLVQGGSDDVEHLSNDEVELHDRGGSLVESTDSRSLGEGIRTPAANAFGYL